MPHSLTDDAIVLRTYNVGETDRFCVLLTRTHGRMTMRASGVRRLLSRRSGGLLPLHRISVTWQKHSYGNLISSAQCLDANDGAWRDPHTFSCAGEGIELLLKLTEDGLALPEVYDLTAEFLRACGGEHSPAVAHLYALKLLQLLGFLPSAATAPGRAPSAKLAILIDAAETLPFTESSCMDAQLTGELSGFVSSLLGNQLGVSLRAAPVSLAISSGVTPICQ